MSNILINASSGILSGVMSIPAIAVQKIASSGIEDIKNSKVEQGAAKIAGTGIALGVIEKIVLDALLGPLSKMDPTISVISSLSSCIIRNTTLIATVGFFTNLIFGSNQPQPQVVSKK